MVPQTTDGPRYAVCSFGGTIAMTGDDGVAPALDGDDLVAAVPALADIGRMECRAVANVGSPSVSFDMLLEGLAWAHRMVDDGAAGVIVTHGTDTMEESAYLLDLLWDRPEPLVVTGAMRSPEEPGADGPANLLDAAIVAASWQACGAGVLVVMNGEVHRAVTVTKTHSFAMDAFASPWMGALGRVVEGAFEPVTRPDGPCPAALPIPERVVNVPIVYPGMGCDGTVLRALLATEDCPGIVIAGMGAGHVPESYLDAVDEAVSRGIPLVMTTRTCGGRTGRTTYAYPGAEIDLERRGVIFAGMLQPLKARILLGVLLGLGESGQTIAEQFERRGYLL
ncbi:asparaginase [Actinobaculum sp. 352]|uniref:asparaginase n=1 Tax=Actinobaculum sp. 352 TaxID=2490946 RepID=UPI002408115C|nr:asparaginase [Actinobaculum sp. 352]